MASSDDFYAEQKRSNRRIAELLMKQGGDASPTSSHLVGANRVLQGLLGGIMMGKGDAEAAERSKAADAAVLGLLPGAETAQPTSPPASPSSGGGWMDAISREARRLTGQPEPIARTSPDQELRAQPASIRFNNPGAQYPGPSATAFGSTGYETIGGGHKIAAFPDPVSGGAAQFDLLDRNYAGMPAGAALDKWTGGNITPQAKAAILQSAGIRPDTVLTKEFFRSPQGIPFATAMSRNEAGRDFPMPQGGWQEAQSRAFQGAPQDPARVVPPNVERAVRQLVAAGQHDKALALAAPYLKPREQFAPVTDAQGNIVGQRSNLTGKVETDPRAPGKPTFGEIDIDPQTGQPRRGFIDPSRRSVEYLPAASGGAPSKIPPVPPGVDPKVWNKAHSEAATAEAMPGTSEGAMKLRREIQDLPSYKNLAQSAPVYRSMLEAAGRDTRASDVNLIYGMAKLMDPGSVVRESEMSVAQAIATLPQNLQAQIKSQMTASGRLSPEVRQGLMEEAHSRVNAYRGMFDQDTGMYRGIAQRGRLYEGDVIPSFGDFKPFTPPTKAVPTATEIDAAREELRRRREQGR